MCTVFIDAVRDCFKKGGFLEKEKDVESGGTFLVGYRGRLFEVEDDMQVVETFDIYNAVGCGARYAKGAMAILTSGREKKDVPMLITKALEVATHFSGGVRPPYVIESV